MTPERIAELRKLLEKATPAEKLTVIRYEHGGGRVYWDYEESNYRYLVADFYHEADREAWIAVRNSAEELLNKAEECEKLRKALEPYADKNNWRCSRCIRRDEINCYLSKYIGPCGEDNQPWDIAREALGKEQG